ncbi:hypothetical protein Q3G72_014275 [Acer saccharum]|nr:hypothetical protein Q3G72_028952 [Acer saccharum]KAK1576482.1 hypothetical protein Q3G72_014275 [Acer saccharum]
MVDVDPEVATAAQTTIRTLKKFSFRGVDLDTVVDSVLFSLSSSSPHVLSLASDLRLSCLIKHLNLASIVHSKCGMFSGIEIEVFRCCLVGIQVIDVLLPRRANDYKAQLMEKLGRMYEVKD